MIIQKYLQWSEGAGARDRARAANALGRAYSRYDLSTEEARSAEAAMALLLDDPSPMVRLALAEAVATSESAPRAIIIGLARDQLEVAGLIVCCSPLLSDADLVDLAADRCPGIRRAIALRPELSPSVCAALAEIGERLTVLEILDNPTARIADLTLRRIMERFGTDGTIRARLLERPDLPSDTRHALIEEVGSALAKSSFVSSVIGRNRVLSITSEACQMATLELASTVSGDEMPALVEHLRVAGKLTPAFLMHSLCVGNIDFFATAIASICSIEPRRVHGLLVDGKRNAIRALYQSGGIDSDICDVFVDATLLWREASRAKTAPSALRITDELVRRHTSATSKATRELLVLVEKLNLNFRRQAARDFAMSMTRAAA